MRLSDKERAALFVAANKASPVVSGSAIEKDPKKPSKGAIYRLLDGQLFRLNADVCKIVGTPRWVE